MSQYSWNIKNSAKIKDVNEGTNNSNMDVLIFRKANIQDKNELFFLPPYAPESNPDEYLNHALKLSVHSGDLPEDRSDIRHKTNSFMRSLQRNKNMVSSFFCHPHISYTLIQR